MPEPSNEVPVNITPSTENNPKAARKMPIMIDTSVEDVIELTPEEKKALAKFEQRKATIKPLIDYLLPDKTLKEHLEAIAKRGQTTVDQLDDKDRGEAEYNRRLANFNKESLIEKIAQTGVADTEMTEYISTLHAFAVSLIPPGSELSSADMRDWIDACDTIESAKFYQKLAEQWKSKFMTDVDEPIARQRAGDLRSILTDITRRKRLYSFPKSQTDQNTTDIFTALEELYEEIYSLVNQRLLDDTDKTFIDRAREVGLTFSDPKQIKLMLQLYKEVANYPDKEIGKKFADAVSHYANHHGLSTEKVQGLIGKLFPAMQNSDPQVKILIKGGNIWGMKKGDFGVADYLCHAYASPINPANLSELLLISREVPATNLSRMEQNRIDALVMARPFGILRDFIHDQRPHVNEVLVAMVHYYDTGNRTRLEQILTKADYFNLEDRTHKMFDKSNYEMDVEERARPGVKIKSIDIIRRLAENTKPIPDAAPVTSDKQLNQRLQMLAQELVGRGKVTKETLASTVDYLNGQLTTMMTDKSVGIEPNHIMAISWVERRAFEVMQNMSYEDQQEAYKQKWFASLLKFQELICSPQYDEKNFQGFLQELVGINSSLDAYKLIGRHTLENIQNLAVFFKQKGRADLGALWSGNLAHELIGLIDPRPAETEQGRKIRDPEYHPGD